MGSRTAANSIWSNSKVPGPGTYAPKDVTETSPKFTMKAKTAQPLNMVIQNDGSHEKVPANLIDSKIPGPGTYSLTQ